MEKKNLINFISKYYLSGRGSEQVLINFGDTVTTKFSGENNTVLGFVEMKIPVNLGTVGIYQTNTLVKLLGAFDDRDDVTINPHYSPFDASKIVSLHFNSNNIDVIAATADPTIIAQAGGLKAEPEYDFVLDLTPELMDNFKRYKAASEAEIFAFNTTPNSVEIIMNYSVTNSNQIKYTLPTKCDDSFLICFNASAISEIFSANKGMTGRISVSNRGLAKIEFADEQFDCKYYIVKTTVN